MALIPIVVLIGIISILIVYNVNIKKKLTTFSSVTSKINKLNALQDFMNITGEDLPVDEKIQKINNVLIDKFEIKYSSIVVFDGAEYVLKASNTDQKYWKNLTNLHTEEIFKDSISTATPKYITIDSEDEKLPYQKMDFSRAKSAMFFPLYIDNVYIGYWILESGTPHDFDNVDTTVLEVIKDNIISVLKTVVHQKTLESIVRKDLFTGLYSAEYLYGEGKKVIDQYTISTICMFKIINLQEINKRYCRELGNKVITKIAEFIKENISKQYIFVRYMGPKFVIAFSGVEATGVADFLNEIKEKIEIETIKLTEQEKNELMIEVKNSKKDKQINDMTTNAKLNFVISSYYKGTGLEEVLKKLEEYLDTTDADESDITNI